MGGAGVDAGYGREVGEAVFAFEGGGMVGGCGWRAWFGFGFGFELGVEGLFELGEFLDLLLNGKALNNLPRSPFL